MWLKTDNDSKAVVKCNFHNEEILCAVMEYQLNINNLFK